MFFSQRQAAGFKFGIVAACLFFSAFLFCSSLFALDVPKRADGYVTDRAGLLSSPAKNRLEQILKEFENRTSNQVVVATFPSLEGNSLEDFSMRLAEAWKVGQKGRDNGVILLIFKDDRKIRIEVGYGLEAVLPDATAGLIIRRVIAPDFKNNDYEAGIFSGVAAILKAIEGEFDSEKVRSEDENAATARLILINLMMFGALILVRFILVREFGIIGLGGMGSYRSGGFGSSGGFSGGGGSFGGGGSSGGW